MSDTKLTSLSMAPNEDWCIKHEGERMLLEFEDTQYVVTVQNTDSW